MLDLLIKRWFFKVKVDQNSSHKQWSREHWNTKFFSFFKSQHWHKFEVPEKELLYVSVHGGEKDLETGGK